MYLWKLNLGILFIFPIAFQSEYQNKKLEDGNGKDIRENVGGKKHTNMRCHVLHIWLG